MKKRIYAESWLAVIGLMVVAGSITQVMAQSVWKAPAASESTNTVAPSQPAAVQLSIGVWDVLKLVRAKIADETIIAFVKNSGRNYGLGASEVIYLREQGVPDKVITAMLNGLGQAPVAFAPPAPVNPQPSPTYVAPPAPAYPQPSADQVPPPPPTYVQPSTVYVAPPAPVYPYYYPSYPSYPYYGYGYGYPGVGVSLGFRFGGYHGYGGHGGHR